MPDPWMGTIWINGTIDATRRPFAIRIVDSVRGKYVVQLLMVLESKVPVSGNPKMMHFQLDAKQSKSPIDVHVQLCAAGQTANRASFRHSSTTFLWFDYPRKSQSKYDTGGALAFHPLPNAVFLF